ncbi:MAG: YlxR family protein [Proteobacteria bacterium]|nr:YlxR family protein [Pseudomonadota bacterium]
MPLRTCIATHQKLPQNQLLRFVNVKGVPTPDPSRRLPGRGIYIVPTAENLALAIQKKAFAHRLKTNRPPLPWEDIRKLLPNP